MSNLRIIYPNADGSVSVLTPLIPVEEVVAKDVPKGAPYSVIPTEELPDRYFRPAWRFAPTGVSVDLPAAKEVQRGKWREARTPLLAALDVNYLRAVESGDKAQQASIATQKQALRDVTKTALPDDLDSIKATWPLPV